MEEDRKTQIIKTAVKRFARHGLGKTTLTEIARDLRIGKATIYHYFTSKEELFYQTVEYDVSLFLEDIKQIFSNEQISFKERFVEYFNYKQEIYNKYKLLYDLLLRILKEESLEKEIEILNKLLQDEEDVLRNILNSLNGKQTEDMKQNLPKFFVVQSWGILFGKKLDDIRNNGSIQNSKEILINNLENLLSLK